MTGKLTTHVLDTALGRPASGLRICLYRLDGEHRDLLKDVVTNDDGRVDGALLEGVDFTACTYELEFHVGYYLKTSGVDLPNPPFLEIIPIRFGIASPDQHYHVPLLLSPYGYSTYRGS